MYRIKLYTINWRPKKKENTREIEPVSGVSYSICFLLLKSKSSILDVTLAVICWK